MKNVKINIVSTSGQRMLPKFPLENWRNVIYFTPRKGRRENQVFFRADISATKSHKDMVDSAFESWDIVLSKSEVLMTVGTHPEELHVLHYNIFWFSTYLQLAFSNDA